MKNEPENASDGSSVGTGDEVLSDDSPFRRKASVPRTLSVEDEGWELLSHNCVTADRCLREFRAGRQTAGIGAKQTLRSPTAYVWKGRIPDDASRRWPIIVAMNPWKLLPDIGKVEGATGSWVDGAGGGANMLYLIGGASRAGKTRLASRLLARHGVPWFSLDVLRTGLHRGAPALGLHPWHDDLADADRLWPILRAISEGLLYLGQDYCMEGVCMRPEHAAELIEQLPGRVRACFLGYPRIAPADKVNFVLQYAGGTNDWLSSMPRCKIEAFIGHQVERSAELEASAWAAGISFFDTGSDYMTGLGAAEQYLLQGTPPRARSAAAEPARH